MTGGQRYRLDRRIATGGMGVVWQATDTLLEREVAVKLLKAEYADDADFRQRFAAEARNAAALQHPNVAGVLDVGELPAEDGSGVPRPIIVMELVPGQPLSTLLRGGDPMPPGTAASLLAQAADGVAAAHALGIVHRDLKPANLLVTPDGTVKITDFGIARAAATVGLTQTGQIVGTPQYVSPEQVDGRPATAASDIYALGIVLYECLAGRRPFEADTPVSTALAHLRSTPDPLPDSVPEHLRAVVATALAKDPADRFTSAGALAAGLRGGPVPGAHPATGAETGPETQALQGFPAAAHRDAPRRRTGPRWLPWLAAGSAVLLVAALVALFARNGTPEAASADGSAPTSTTSTAASTPDVRVLPDDYLGRPAGRVAKALAALGLDVREVRWDNTTGHDPGTVGAVRPSGILQPGTVVTISVWGQPPPASSNDGSGSGAGAHGDDKAPGKSGKAPGKGPGKNRGHGKAKGKKK
jgi:serine/threonine-protein kinase